MAKSKRKNGADLSEQANALAEQLGRIAGTIEGTAESWVNQQQLTDQLTRVRDGATQMLEGLSSGIAKGRAAVGSLRLTSGQKSKRGKKAAPAPRMQADPARAAGKRRRKPAPSMKGVKKSDERIPKMRTAATVRQRRKSYA
jgi:hypothetical protein